MSRIFSKINNSIWASKRFKSLSDSHKLFYLYCLTCPHGNSAGCFVSPIGYMMAGLGWKEAQIIEAIECVSETGLIAYDHFEDTLYLHRWFEFNSPTNPKHALKIFSDTLSVPDCALRKRCIIDLKRFVEDQKWKINEKLHKELDRVSRLGDTETETETETVLDIYTRTREKEKIKTENSKPEKSNAKISEFTWPDTGEIFNLQMLFEKCWHEFPKNKPKGNRQTAFEKFKKAVNASPHNYLAIINGIKAYRELCENTRCYNQHFSTWLHEKGWMTDWLSQTNETKGPENGKSEIAKGKSTRSDRLHQAKVRALRDMGVEI